MDNPNVKILKENREDEEEDIALLWRPTKLFVLPKFGRLDIQAKLAILIGLFIKWLFLRWVLI